MVKSHIHMLDKVYKLDAAGFTIDVQVLDIKTSYGVTRAQVTPVHGAGIHWVDITRLEGEGVVRK